MPRSRGSSSPRSAPARSAPSRPTVAPPRPAPQQQRPSSTAAHPPANAGQQQQQQGSSQSPGLFGQMASTAAGVAVGSSIGHAVSSLFFGGSAATPEQQAADSALSAQASPEYQSNPNMRSCDQDAKAFTKCLDDNMGPHQMSVCGWYLEQLKACQQAAKPY